MSANHDHTAKFRNDLRSTEELLGLALTKDPDLDDEGYWQPVAALQYRLPEILSRVQAWSSSSDEKERDTAATILGQSRIESKFAPDHCAAIVLQMLARERAASILTSIIFALGHLRDPRAIEPLAKLGSHCEKSVRYAVVSSLCGCAEEQAVTTLIQRSMDDDPEVRNWATFGLGSQIDTDTPAIREALIVRLRDEDDEIRGEALVGLARRGDLRVVAALLKELAGHEQDELRDWVLIGEAAEAAVSHACTSRSMEWAPVLARLRTLGVWDQAKIQAAIERCSPPQDRL